MALSDEVHRLMALSNVALQEYEDRVAAALKRDTEGDRLGAATTAAYNQLQEADTDEKKLLAVNVYQATCREYEVFLVTRPRISTDYREYDTAFTKAVIALANEVGLNQRKGLWPSATKRTG